MCLEKRQGSTKAEWRNVNAIIASATTLGWVSGGGFTGNAPVSYKNPWAGVISIK